jgi:hypothetical protein
MDVFKIIYCSCVIDYIIYSVYYITENIHFLEYHNKLKEKLKIKIDEIRLN